LRRIGFTNDIEASAVCTDATRRTNSARGRLPGATLTGTLEMSVFESRDYLLPSWNTDRLVERR
jgi:hypothetical protein